MKIEDIQAKNSHIEIKDVTSEAFLKYGKVLNNYDFSSLINYLEEKTEVPANGNVYVGSVEDMEAFDVKTIVQEELYGEAPIQIGYCNGKNSTLNGLEYHKCNEIDIAATDLVLLLGSVQDISNNKYEAAKVEAFYLAKGAAVELYATTLHYAPCKLTDSGFKCVVILTQETNTPLAKVEKRSGEGELLFMKNKWLLVHSSRQVLIDKGAHVGIIGENIEVKF
jgi:hypothetical protein